MVKRTSHKKNRIAMVAGFILGGWISTVTYLVGHNQVKALPMLWLLVAGGLMYSAMAEAAWPLVRKKKFTAISLEEHRRVVAREPKKERKLYYEMLWET